MNQITESNQTKALFDYLEKQGFNKKEFKHSTGKLRLLKDKTRVGTGILGTNLFKTEVWTHPNRITHKDSERYFSYDIAKALSLFTDVSFTLTDRRSGKNERRERTSISIETDDWTEILLYFQLWVSDLQRQLGDSKVGNSVSHQNWERLTRDIQQKENVSPAERQFIKDWLYKKLIKELTINASYFSKHFSQERKTELLQTFKNNRSEFDRIINNKVDDLHTRLEATENPKDYFSKLFGFVSIIAISLGGFYWGYNELLGSLAASWTLMKNSRDGLK